tara:strand:- start:280 stop:525 length:246 start_codon:yes stop_codon:yes gene_type:complete
MPFISQKSSIAYETIEGKEIAFIKPEVEITIKHKETGKEYMSDAEMEADINDPNTPTKREHIKRDVHVKVAQMPLAGKSKL